MGLKEIVKQRKLEKAKLQQVKEQEALRELEKQNGMSPIMDEETIDVDFVDNTLRQLDKPKEKGLYTFEIVIETNSDALMQKVSAYIADMIKLSKYNRETAFLKKESKTML